ncbi:hypothetical protein BDV93DRAFT_565854 [Ceratobasidium sp. AG-I]|nr:hypothetical protein BDV93DRAFT_565854 [Ceratobasidium sp. AG-I]
MTLVRRHMIIVGLRMILGNYNTTLVRRNAASTKFNTIHVNLSAQVRHNLNNSNPEIALLNGNQAGLCHHLEFWDQSGCDFTSYHMRNRSFYDKSLTIDSSEKMNIVTRLITPNGATHGALKEIRRAYRQDGKITQIYTPKGGRATTDKPFNAGVSRMTPIQDNHAVNMLQLDNNYPVMLGALARSRLRNP